VIIETKNNKTKKKANMSSVTSAGSSRGTRGSSSSSDGTPKEKRGSNNGEVGSSSVKGQRHVSSSDEDEAPVTMDVSTKRHWSSSSDEALSTTNKGNDSQSGGGGSRSASPKDGEGSPPPNQEAYRLDSSGSDESDADLQGKDDEEDSSDSKKRKSSHSRPQRKLRKGDDGAISLRSSTRELRRASVDGLQSSPALPPIVPGSNPYNIILTPESMLSKDVDDLPSGWSTMVKPRFV